MSVSSFFPDLLGQTLKPFRNNDELKDEEVMIRKNMGIIHHPG